MENRLCSDGRSIVDCFSDKPLSISHIDTFSDRNNLKVELVEIENSNGETMKAVIKIMIANIDDLEEKERIINEAQFSIDMANAKIGPKIYDAFYEVRESHIFQYLIMEYYDHDGSSFMRSYIISLSQKRMAFKMMIDLIYKQIYKEKLYCIDIKPINFVARIKNGFSDVKMIDFGAHYCNRNYIIFNDNIDLMYYMNVLMLYISISNYNKRHGNISSVLLENEDFRNFVADKDLVRSCFQKAKESNDNEYSDIDQYFMFYRYTNWLAVKNRKDDDMSVEYKLNKFYAILKKDMEYSGIYIDVYDREKEYRHKNTGSDDILSDINKLINADQRSRRHRRRSKKA
jgi:hypothetical protein